MKFNHLLLFVVFAWTLTIPEIYEIGGSWGVFDWIRGWINWLIRWPVNGFRRFWNVTVVAFLSELHQNIVNLISWIWNRAEPFFAWVTSRFDDLMSHLWNTVWPKIREILGSIGDILSHLWNTVWPKIREILGSIGDILSHLWNTVWPKIREILDWIKGAPRWVSDQLGKLKDVFLGESGLIMKTIRAFIGAIYDALVWFVERVWGGV